MGLSYFSPKLLKFFGEIKNLGLFRLLLFEDFFEFFFITIKSAFQWIFIFLSKE